jgi:transposase
MDAAIRYDTEIVGALPVITQYLEKLQLARTIDAQVPWEGDVPLGTLVEVLILNRLLAPKAMFRIDSWAQRSGVAGYYALTAGDLNDDRLGRALERLAAHADTIAAALVLAAVRGFKLDVRQVHYDITSVELFGAYELEPGQAPPQPLPTYGRTKSGRKNLKQVQLGLNVSGDGGVPLAHAPLDGNAPESPTHLDNLRRLKQILPRQSLLYVADTKLDTPENLLTVRAGQGQFLCGGVFSPKLQEVYLANRGQLRPVDYHPKSQEQLDPEDRDRYQAFERAEQLSGTVEGQAVRLRYRTIFVWSESKARQEAQTRERHLGKVQAAIDAVARNLNRYSLRTREQIVRRLEQAKGKYIEGKLIEYELSEDGKGQFHLSCKTDEKALEQWKLLEGVYVLKTDLPRRQYPLAATLAKYKEQSCVERRIHHLKGPLAVTPMFLKNPDRIAGLLCILVWALTVLALMERQVRGNLKGKRLYGLYPENRPSPSPTGPALLDAFSTLCVVIIKHRRTVARRLAELSPIQQRLLSLLDIPAEHLRAYRRALQHQNPGCGM